MIRPPSIVNFERCYLAATALGLVNTAIGWKARMALPQVQQAQAQLPGLMGPLIVGGVVIGVAINLLLWFFAARKGYVGAKYVIVVFFVLGLLGMVLSAANGSLANGVTGVVGIVALVLNAIAMWLLFRPDAKLWFGQETSPEEPFK